MDVGLKISAFFVLGSWVFYVFIDCFDSTYYNLNAINTFTTYIILTYFIMGISSMIMIGLIFNSCCIVCSPISEDISTCNVWIMTSIYCFLAQELVANLLFAGEIILIVIELIIFILLLH